jgi:hypothetical protein
MVLRGLVFVHAHSALRAGINPSCLRFRPMPPRSETRPMPLPDAEYEDAYAEALFCLADGGHAVGVPFIDGTATRHCYVDDRRLSDKGVLELWWGKDIARNILRGR